jgi:hypothetical protein
MENRQYERPPPGGRRRETRTRMMVAARLGVDRRWTDVTILNASRRGLMITTEAPVARGAYVEIRKGVDIAMTGRVVWTSGRRAGLRTQDDVDVGRLSGIRGVSTTAPRGERERRSATRRATPDAIAQRGRHAAAAMQYAGIVAAVAIGAYIAATTVHDRLSAVTSQLIQVM